MTDQENYNRKSRGHVSFDGKYEYVIFEGEREKLVAVVWRGNAFGLDGQRMGLRLHSKVSSDVSSRVGAHNSAS